MAAPAKIDNGALLSPIPAASAGAVLSPAADYFSPAVAMESLQSLDRSRTPDGRMDTASLATRFDGSLGHHSALAESPSAEPSGEYHGDFRGLSRGVAGAASFGAAIPGLAHAASASTNAVSPTSPGMMAIWIVIGLMFLAVMGMVGGLIRFLREEKKAEVEAREWQRRNRLL